MWPKLKSYDNAYGNFANINLRKSIASINEFLILNACSGMHVAIDRKQEKFHWKFLPRKEGLSMKGEYFWGPVAF